MKKLKKTEVPSVRDSRSANKSKGSQKPKNQVSALSEAERIEAIDNVVNDYIELIDEAKTIFNSFHDAEYIAMMLDSHAQLLEQCKLTGKPEIAEFHTFRRFIVGLMRIFEDQIETIKEEAEASGTAFWGKLEDLFSPLEDDVIETKEKLPLVN